MSVSISVVVPVFRSGATLRDLHLRVAATLDALTPDWELILVDDGSGDDTPHVLAELHAQDPRVHVVQFARNRGQHHATLCGLQRARGEVVVTMDDDLQHAPEDIPQLLEKLDEGFDLVIGRARGPKAQGRSRNLASRVMQGLLGRVLGKPGDLEFTSFRAMSRRAADGISAYRGAHAYLPALILDAVPAGRITNLDVTHHPRANGASQYTLRKLVRLASYLVINHSLLPLRFVAMFGLSVCLASFGYAGYLLVVTLGPASPPRGFPTLALLQSFLSGSVLLCLGIVGEYIGRLVEEASQPRQFPIFEELPARREA